MQHNKAEKIDWPSYAAVCEVSQHNQAMPQAALKKNY